MIVMLPVSANDVDWESFCEHTYISNDKSVKSKVCGFLVYNLWSCQFKVWHSLYCDWIVEPFLSFYFLPSRHVHPYSCREVDFSACHTFQHHWGDHQIITWCKFFDKLGFMLCEKFGVVRLCIQGRQLIKGKLQESNLL